MLACTELIQNYYNLTNMKKENPELIKSIACEQSPGCYLYTYQK